MQQPDHDFRQAVKDRYRFSEWAGKVEGDEGITRQGVRLPEDLVEGWLQERVHDLSEIMQAPATRYVYARADAADRQRVMVKLFEYGSPLDGHEALIDIVMASMAPSLPPCEELGVRAGDICFGSHGDLTTDTIFARYNVLVHVQSIGQTAVSVAAFATAIDGLLR